VLSDWNLTPQGKCNKCGATCAGHFEAAPGNWGAKRQPIRLRASA
jgi:pyruvate formate lyase activating enzyme